MSELPLECSAWQSIQHTLGCSRVKGANLRSYESARTWDLLSWLERDVLNDRDTLPQPAKYLHVAPPWASAWHSRLWGSLVPCSYHRVAWKAKIRCIDGLSEYCLHCWCIKNLRFPRPSCPAKPIGRVGGNYAPTAPEDRSRSRPAVLALAGGREVTSTRSRMLGDDAREDAIKGPDSRALFYLI